MPTESGTTTATTLADVIAGLNDLLQLDHDAAGAYEIAIERLTNRELAVQIEGFKRDHERHIRSLNEVIQGLGGSPVNEPHASAPFKEAIQRIAAVGGDASILAAWRVNELQVTSRYDRYAQRANGWPAEAKRIVDENALDEERHYRWIVELLSGGDSPETHLGNRLREGVTRAKVVGDRARVRAERAAGDTRARAAQGLYSAADRLGRLADEQPADSEVRARMADGARGIARGLESTATYIRDGGSEDLKMSLESQIRESPARSLVTILAVGFVIGRIIR